MKRRTYNNVLKAIKIVQKKGYSFEESRDIVLKVFDEHENGQMSIEFYLDKIVSKEEYIYTEASKNGIEVIKVLSM